MIDKRVIERQIRKGKLDAAAYRRTLEALPDVSDRVARDTDVEPTRSVVSAPSMASTPSSGGHERAPEALSAADNTGDDDEDDEDEDEDDEDDDEEEGDEPSDTATSV